VLNLEKRLLIIMVEFLGIEQLEMLIFEINVLKNTAISKIKKS
jgi:hypothetical protein